MLFINAFLFLNRIKSYIQLNTYLIKNRYNKRLDIVTRSPANCGTSYDSSLLPPQHGDEECTTIF